MVLFSVHVQIFANSHILGNKPRFGFWLGLCSCRWTTLLAASMTASCCTPWLWMRRWQKVELRTTGSTSQWERRTADFGVSDLLRTGLWTFSQGGGRCVALASHVTVFARQFHPTFSSCSCLVVAWISIHAPGTFSHFVQFYPQTWIHFKELNLFLM